MVNSKVRLRTLVGRNPKRGQRRSQLHSAGVDCRADKVSGGVSPLGDAEGGSVEEVSPCGGGRVVSRVKA